MKKVWFGILFSCGLLLSADNLLPDFGNLRFDGKNSIWEGKNKKALFFFSPQSAISNLKVSTEKDALVIHLDRFFASGGKNIQVNFRVTDPRFFKVGEMEQTVCIQGPKGAKVTLFFEGYTRDRKHMTQRTMLDLNGEKQIFSFKGGFSIPVSVLSLRYDFSSDGIYKFHALDLVQCE